jgi:hypothetical protein
VASTNSHVIPAIGHIGKTRRNLKSTNLNQDFRSMHATLKITIHNQRTQYIFSTVDMNTATSTPWHYLNTSTVHLSYCHMNKCIYSYFTTIIISVLNSTQRNKIQCFNSSITETIRHILLEIQSVLHPIPNQFPLDRHVSHPPGKQVLSTIYYCIFCSFYNYRFYKLEQF